MKKLSSTLCAIACMLGTTANATETAPSDKVEISADIDNVLNELSRQQNKAPSLVKTSFEPTSYATQSSLINRPVQVDNDNHDLLSHLTLVASNSVSNFTQTGRASWYGSQFHGRRTASGERFDMHSLTAAHPSLPFNTLLRVTNKNNGQSVVVKVNDRGPFHGNRVLDLSYGAAKQIGLVSRGVANVLIERVSPR